MGLHFDNDAYINLLMTLKEARERMGLTQDQLAGRAGTTQAAISYLESGQTKSPSLALATRIAKVLKVKPEALFPVEVGK